VSRAWRDAQQSQGPTRGGAAPGARAIDDPGARGVVRGTRLQGSGQRPTDAPSAILAAARACLLEDGYGRLSTRRVAEAAGVPLSQIHYHFGSRQQLVLGILAAENERLLERQARMYAGPEPLWQHWEQACDFLDEDLRSGYVRVLQEMIAAGWSDPAVATAVRELVAGWFRLLTDVAERVQARGGNLGPFTAPEIGALLGLPFVGAEPMLLLGMADDVFPARSALRKVGALIRAVEQAGALGDDVERASDDGAQSTGNGAGSSTGPEAPDPPG
jgi:AcrR family transcriptional regulator